MQRPARSRFDQLADVVSVARLLLRIVTNPRPRLRYTTGPIPERAAIWLKRLMPYSLVEKVMDFYYSR